MRFVAEQKINQSINKIKSDQTNPNTTWPVLKLTHPQAAHHGSFHSHHILLTQNATHFMYVIKDRNSQFCNSTVSTADILIAVINVVTRNFSKIYSDLYCHIFSHTTCT